MYPTPERPAPVGSIIDTHAHYNDKRFSDDADTLFKEMTQSGVKHIINCGCDINSSIECIGLSEQYPCCYTAVGYHPENLPDSDINLFEISKLLRKDKVVAIGEIGLDYYWRQDNKELQKKAFISQLELSVEHKLPVIIHDREAHSDTMDILRKYKPKGVMHCFSGSTETARELVKMGIYIGIGGVLTFKNSRKLKEVAADIPLEYILLETDAPYLAPEPFRGKTNNSSLIIYVAEALAEIKGISVDEVLKTTKQNAEKLFDFK